MAFINACISDSSAPYRDVKRVQFGILSPDEIVSASAASPLALVIAGLNLLVF
jgi:hypothetical protein